MNKETGIQNQIRIAASKAGARLLRYAVGVFYTRDGRPQKIGTPGVSDLIGWREIIVTPSLVGKKIAQFVACEVKTETGRLSPQQKCFLETVENAGGLAVVARSEKEIAEAIKTLPRDGFLRTRNL